MARIAVIGAGGFIGGHVCAEAVRQGHEVYGFFHSSPTDPLGLVQKLAGVEISDCREAEFPGRVAGVQPDAVVYAVSLDHTKSEVNVAETIAVNLVPMISLLRVLAASDALNSFVYLSTAQIYGPIENGKQLSSASPLLPGNLYALTHLFCEQVLDMYGRLTGKNFLSVRITNSFGFPVFPSANSGWLVLNDFCAAAVHKGKIVLSSDGKGLRDFVWVRDVARGVVGHASNPGPSGLVDFASGTSISVLSAAQTVSIVATKKTGRTIRVVGPDDSDFGLDDMDQSIKTFDPEYFLNLLGDEGPVALEAGIEELIEYELARARIEVVGL